MPTLRKKSTSEGTAKRGRSKSPGRSSSRSRSRGRSPSRSPGRPKSPSRSKATKEIKEKPAASPARVSRADTKAKTPPSTPTRKAKAEVVKTPSTPTRRSTRIVNQEKEEKPQTISSPKAKQPKASEKPKCSRSDPILALLSILIQPAILLYMNEACSKKSCDIRKIPAIPKDVAAYINKESILAVLGFIAVQFILVLLPVGKLVEGRPLKGGQRLKYRCNGLLAFVVTALAFAGAVYKKVPFNFVLINLRQLMVATTLLCFIVSLLLYFRARKLTASAKASNTGNWIYDFYMGRELNPRFGSFDLKFFGLRLCYLGWAVVNGCFLASAYAKGPVNPALALAAAGQILYTFDFFLFEDSVLNGLDITSEGLGFMLLFCDLAWIPFLHTLSTRYLLLFPQSPSNYVLAAVLFLNVVGYIIYRGANNQKNKIIQNPHSPDLAHLETIPTSSGRKLLISGWWGLCRHPNYLGDCLMILSWACYCGTASLIPYVYPVYFLFHMMYRQHWDDDMCKQKYGAAWDRYCERVRYRLIPYIY